MGLGIFCAHDLHAIHDNVSAEIEPLSAKATLVAGDFLLIEDSATGFSKKKVAASNIVTGAPHHLTHETGGTDEVDHNLLINLAVGDVHTQYLTTGRADTWFTGLLCGIPIPCINTCIDGCQDQTSSHCIIDMSLAIVAQSPIDRIEIVCNTIAVEETLIAVRYSAIDID